jgi:hypothetical protein
MTASSSLGTYSLQRKRPEHSCFVVRHSGPSGPRAHALDTAITITGNSVLSISIIPIGSHSPSCSGRSPHYDQLSSRNVDAMALPERAVLVLKPVCHCGSMAPTETMIEMTNTRLMPKFPLVCSSASVVIKDRNQWRRRYRRHLLHASLEAVTSLVAFGPFGLSSSSLSRR